MHWYINNEYIREFVSELKYLNNNRYFKLYDLNDISYILFSFQL